MLPESQLSNYWRSLNAYIETNYTLTAKILIDEELDTESLSEWVEFIWASQISHSFIRHADNANMGNLMDASIGAIICVKPVGVAGRIFTIRDVVVDLLRRPLITVKDWVSSKTEIGTLQGEGLINDVSLRRVDDINKWSLMFKFRYQEKFERIR